MSEQSEPHYELVMPFVVVQSQGGVFDDDAYCAGFEMGTLDQTLALNPMPVHDVMIHAQNRPQADLIAMRYGYTTDEISVDESGTWSQLKLTRGSTL